MIDLLQVTEPRLAYIVLGGFVVVFSVFSLLIREKLYISEVVIGTTFGVIMGPHCADVFDPRRWAPDTGVVTLEVMRVVLAVGLFAIGVELPGPYMMKHVRGLIVLVVPTMAIGWIVVAGFMLLLFPSLNFISCLAISACLTPTDPVISAAIIGGKYAHQHVPVNLRRIIAAESASNDGLAYPFLSISIFLTVEATTREAFGKWFLVGWLYQVILGTLFGAVMGYGFRKALNFSHDRGLADRESFVAQFLALALFTTGVASSLGMDDLLAAFAAGTAVSWDGRFNRETEEESFSSVVDLMLNCACFVYIGAWLDFRAFDSPHLGITPWRLVVLFLWIMVFRRIPALLVLYRWVPEINTWQEALFTGHFGPMGVGAVFVSTLALSELKVPHDPPQDQEEFLAATLQIIVSFIVLCSIIIHGLSIPFFSFSRRIHSRTVSLTRTWTSGHGGRGQGQTDWVNWVKRPGSAPPSQIASRQDEEAGDEEAGDGSEIQSVIEGISEVDRKPGTPSNVNEDARITQVSYGPEETVLQNDSQGVPSGVTPSEAGQAVKTVRFPPSAFFAE